jgi:hypothetical protein
MSIDYENTKRIAEESNRRLHPPREYQLRYCIRCGHYMDVDGQCKCRHCENCNRYLKNDYDGDICSDCGLKDKHEGKN